MRTLPRRTGERGFTLVETMVGMVLMTSIVGIVGPMMISAMTATSRVEFQSRAVDELRQAVHQIGRELRSARCIATPAPNTGTAGTLAFTTEANNTTYDVTYAVTGGKLVRTVGTSSRVVAKYLTAGTFEHFATPRRSVALSFTVRVDNRQKPDTLATTIAGRNAWRACL
jgi:prepilin-type N-terminal cleavage/methylation domain-containing protein